MIARFFIDRPILANVLALLMLLLGAVSLINLPVAQYPQLTPPTIQVTTSYPGANALTVQQQVARTIEQQVNGVEGMIYMQSNSSNDGRYTLTVTFAVGTNTDQAQVAVQPSSRAPSWASRREKGRRRCPRLLLPPPSLLLPLQSLVQQGTRLPPAVDRVHQGQYPRCSGYRRGCRASAGRRAGGSAGGGAARARAAAAAAALGMRVRV